jgi:hypothetical protein
MSVAKPTIPEIEPFVRDLYRRSCVGCCLHIVLDDGNIEDGNVKFCVEYAREMGHAECEKLASMMLLMSKTQRKKLGARAYAS